MFVGMALDVVRGEGIRRGEMGDFVYCRDEMARCKALAEGQDDIKSCLVF
jgi:hypothetical protein